MAAKIRLGFNGLVKTGFAALLAVSLIFPDLPQFAGKAMMERSVVYSLGILTIPVVWSFFLRKRFSGYPHLADALFSLPFVIDLAGNAFNLFEMKLSGPLRAGGLKP